MNTNKVDVSFNPVPNDTYKYRLVLFLVYLCNKENIDVAGLHIVKTRSLFEIEESFLCGVKKKKEKKKNNPARERSYLSPEQGYN